MTREQIEADRQEFEATTVATRVQGEDVTIAELRTAFEAVQDSEHWKNPIDRRVDADKLFLTEAAIQFYHGASPIIIATRHSKNHRSYRIKSHGYAA